MGVGVWRWGWRIHNSIGGEKQKFFGPKKKKIEKNKSSLGESLYRRFERGESGEKTGRSKALKDGAWLGGNKGDERKQGLKLEDRKTREGYEK